MKTIIYLFLSLLVFSGCTVWEESETEMVPLPSTVPEIVPAPWDKNNIETDV